jgi:hypothetical protein
MLPHDSETGITTRKCGHRQQTGKTKCLCSENGAKGNVHMESFNGRLKSENRLRFWEQDDFASLNKVVDRRIWYYNRVRRHLALGNKSPIRYLKEKG